MPHEGVAVAPSRESNPGNSAERYRITRRVTLIGAASNVVMSIIQFTFGIIGHSQSLIADAIHSLSDLITDIFAVIGAKQASRAADEEHPYGHERMETAATVILSLVMVVAAGVIIFDATQRLFDPGRLLQPAPIVLVVAFLSVLVKETMYRYTLRAARKLRSNLLQTNAWHHRSDALSSVIVIVGVGGTMAGLNYLDAIAAIGVAIMIARVGIQQSWHALQELVDHALDPDQISKIQQKILTVPGVNELHMLRTRKMGGNALVDVHILVQPKLSVSEAHQISESVRAKLIGEIDEVTDVTIHIDPEDDFVAKPSSGLRSRSQIVEALHEDWKNIPEASEIQDITLHYLDGRIHVEVHLPLTVAGSLEHALELREAFANLAKKEDDIAEIKVAFV